MNASTILPLTNDEGWQLASAVRRHPAKGMPAPPSQWGDEPGEIESTHAAWVNETLFPWAEGHNRLHELEDALIEELAVAIGTGQLETGRCVYSEARAALLKLRGEEPAEFDRLSLAERTHGHVHPSTGRLIKLWLLTESEISQMLRRAAVA